jgi:Na+-translocating ferredoxin:NAD+ oxidoreductase subunit G
MKTTLKLGITLALFAAGACVALALVYTVTGPTIEGLAAKQLTQDLKDLFPEADNFRALNGDVKSPDPSVRFDQTYEVTRLGAPLGVAIKATGNSYGGETTMLVGVGTDRRITGVKIQKNIDTPGLGANSTNPTYFVDKRTKTTFPGQFFGKPLSDAFEVKKDVVAITASTITSKALTNMVKQAGIAASSYLERTAQGGN